MKKWHVHVTHMAKHMNMVEGFFGGGPGPRTPLNPVPSWQLKPFSLHHLYLLHLNPFIH